jgi:hypothetical protein
MARVRVMSGVGAKRGVANGVGVAINGGGVDDKRLTATVLSADRLSLEWGIVGSESVHPVRMNSPVLITIFNTYKKLQRFIFTTSSP